MSAAALWLGGPLVAVLAITHLGLVIRLFDFVFVLSLQEFYRIAEFILVGLRGLAVFLLDFYILWIITQIYGGQSNSM